MTEDFLHDHCNFEENRVYVLFAIARKNENEDITTSTEIIFREVLKNETDIHRKVSKLRAACAGYEPDDVDAPTFRLYVTVNARDSQQAFFNYQERINGWVHDLLNGDDAARMKMKKVDSYWISELQKPENRDGALFLWDYDGEYEAPVGLQEDLKSKTEIVGTRETPNGYHIITTPFNYTDMGVDLREVYNVELKTDGMVFLEYLT